VRTRGKAREKENEKYLSPNVGPHGQVNGALERKCSQNRLVDLIRGSLGVLNDCLGDGELRKHLFFGSLVL
jgi:hypothetical protein